MFVIRTNYNQASGAGHYMRMLRLAHEIKKRSKVVIVLDKKEKVHYEKNIEHFFLYKNKFINQKIDSVLFNKFINKYNSKKINLIVDDYRLGSFWEKKVKKNVNKLIVFDDYVTRKHSSDYYVNFKNLNNSEKNLLDKNISKNTFKITGNKYSIINKKLFKKKIKQKNLFNLLFYPGNSGNSIFFYKLVEKILKKFSQSQFNVNINLILGLNTSGVEKYEKLKKKFSNLTIIKNTFNIEKHLNLADIYFGFAGNALYENSYLKLISFLFPLNSNQYNDSKNLEGLGHYFLMKKNFIHQSDKIVRLTERIFLKFQYIKSSFFKNSEVSKNGAKYIVNKFFNKNEITKKKGGSKNINNNLRIKKIKLTDINDYLKCRNLIFNRKYMINNRKISLIDHYNWWFSNDFKEKKNFKIKFNKNSLIFIWHKKIYFKKRNYLIGGWFSNGKNVPITNKVVVLKWQLKKTKKTNYKWLAVIKKNNVSTFKMNKILGFMRASRNSLIYNVIKDFFGINPKKYYLMYY